MRSRLAAYTTGVHGDLRNRLIGPMLKETNPFNHRNKIRPGLNVFDNDGNELDWDYEHDTRFFKESDKPQDDTDDQSDVQIVDAPQSSLIHTDRPTSRNDHRGGVEDPRPNARG